MSDVTDDIKREIVKIFYAGKINKDEGKGRWVKGKFVKSPPLGIPWEEWAELLEQEGNGE